MDFFQSVKGKLIVSCQAQPHEPLHSSFIMAKMAKAAQEGGAAGIRAESLADILAIKKEVDLGVIGLIKAHYSDSEIYITPTLEEVEALIVSKCEMIALDMTNRPRPNNVPVEALVKRIQEAGRLVLADISTYDEAIAAEKLGVDGISTTLSGYTPYSPQQEEADFELMQKLVADCKVPIFAEGRLNTPADLQKAMSLGVHAAIIGSSITRPQLITKSFVKVLEQ